MSFHEYLQRVQNGSLLEELLSPVDDRRLEEMARKAHHLSLCNFGRTIQLYTPVYVSDYCDNGCLYCGFSADNTLERRKLTLEQLRKEAEVIAGTGLKNVLLLTGGSRDKSPLSYIKECVGVLNRYFTSVCVEIYALSEREYKELVDAGVDGLTVYQETYDKEIYGRVHPSGPKKDYDFRLKAPWRAARAGMRTVNIGALLGLASWRGEVLAAGMHARYLQETFPEAEISISIPRLRPCGGDFKVEHPVGDRDIVQIVTALRLFLPRIGITLSTRESAGLRENLIPLGITRMSAGSTTAVGGRTAGKNSCQFEIADKRDVAEIKALLKAKGYQPVLKDWVGYCAVPGLTDG